MRYRKQTEKSSSQKLLLFFSRNIIGRTGRKETSFNSDSAIKIKKNLKKKDFYKTLRENTGAL